MVNRQLLWMKTFRFILALGCLLIVAAILWYLALRGRPRPVEPVGPESIPGEKVIRQEGIEHFDIKGERIIQVKAAQHYAGQNGRYYLEGGVELRAFDRDSGRERILRGERITYDRDWNEILVEGRASIEQEGWKIESSLLRYRKEPEMVSTESGGCFASPKIRGEAKKLSYAMGARSLRLEEDVELEFRDEATAGDFLGVQARAFEYSRVERRGQAWGGATFFLGQNRGQAERLSFEVTEGEESIARIELRGKAMAFLVSDATVQEIKEEFPVVVAKEREIQAETVVLTPFPDSHHLQALQAEGSCFLKSVAEDGAVVLIRALSARAYFDPQGRVQEFLALGQASLEERSGDATLKRKLEGESIRVDEQGARIAVLASRQGEARLESPESEIISRTIVSASRGEIIEATEEVRLVLKARPEKEGSLGFFGRQKPIFATAGRMRFERGTNRFLFRESVRLWQDRNVIMAEELTVDEETGEMTGRGKSRAVFFASSRKEEKEERIDVGGEKMGFDSQTSLLTFEGEGWVRTARVSLGGERLVLSLAQGKAEVLTVEARGRVTVRDSLRESQSEVALYVLEKDTLVLTGNPVVRDKSRGVVRGDKLTFALGDDRIFVENKEKERSTTVIKRDQ